MKICLNYNCEIAAVTGWKNDENNRLAKEQIKTKLQADRIVAITPSGKIVSTNVKDAKESNNLDIFIFNPEGGANKEVQRYRIHLTSEWNMEGRDNKRPLHIAAKIKRQFDLLPGDNTLINKDGKKIVITISDSATVSFINEKSIPVSYGKEKFEFYRDSKEEYVER